MQGVGSEETGVGGAFLSSCGEAKCLIWGKWGLGVVLCVWWGVTCLLLESPLLREGMFVHVSAPTRLHDWGL